MLNHIYIFFRLFLQHSQAELEFQNTNGRNFGDSRLVTSQKRTLVFHKVKKFGDYNIDDKPREITKQELLSFSEKQEKISHRKF